MEVVMKVIRKASPNRFPIRLVEIDGLFYVEEMEDGYWDSYVEYENLSSATEHFEERVRELAQTPNWEAQAEYDELHGTDNGYAPWDYGREY
jgi:hypothetical protein